MERETGSLTHALVHCFLSAAILLLWVYGITVKKTGESRWFIDSLVHRYNKGFLFNSLCQRKMIQFLEYSWPKFCLGSKLTLQLPSYLP